MFVYLISGVFIINVEGHVLVRFDPGPRHSEQITFYKVVALRENVIKTKYGQVCFAFTPRILC